MVGAEPMLEAGAEQLVGGIRIENDYVVTASGVRNLTKAPLELM